MMLNSEPEISETSNNRGWTYIIRPASGWLNLNLRDLWRYRDLLVLFVKRDFVTVYKQTVLGPLWFLLQPLLTTFVFTLIFGKMAKLPTDGVPPMLFYLLGTTVWSYFSSCLVKTSSTFVSNVHIFGKVYFPRLTVPIATVISSLVSFCIQISLYLAVLLAFAWKGQVALEARPSMLLLPFLVCQMAALGLGCGIIVSSLTIRYRDFVHLVGFGAQLWMFVTPVVYPASMIPSELKWLLILNPMASIIETFRFAFHGVGVFDVKQFLISAGITMLILVIGIVLFTRVEKNFADTI
jgi:lipopolysaccharide transport system permease protein